MKIHFLYMQKEQFHQNLLMQFKPALKKEKIKPPTVFLHSYFEGFFWAKYIGF